MSTHPTSPHPGDPGRVAVPADVDRPDTMIAGLTARQTLILAAAALGLWLLWQATRHVVSPLAYTAAVSPLAATAVALALGRRDGLPLDRWLLAALAHARTPRRQVNAPEGIPTPPDILPVHLTPGPVPAPATGLADGVDPDGTVRLGRDGASVLARVSTVNFALRTPAEQGTLVAAYGAWLNSLDAPVQILVRATRLDLAPTVAALREHAPALPHPALEAAARDHAGFLAELAAGRDLLHRHVLLVHHQPPGHPSGSTTARLARGVEHAARRLAAADLTVTRLPGLAATAVLHDACNPDTPATDQPAPDDGAGDAATGRTGEPAPVPVRGRTHTTTRHGGWALAAHPDQRPVDPWGEP
jgi:PrgI family protein